LTCKAFQNAGKICTSTLTYILEEGKYISVHTGNQSNNVRDPCAYLIIILKLMTIDEGRMLSGFIISCKTTSNTWALVCKRFAACILQRPITNTLESTVLMLFLV
jgi:hypothetical protein